MKKTRNELINLMSNAITRPDSLWRHNKTGKLYKIVDNVIDCNTNEIIVTYTLVDPMPFGSSLYGFIFARTLAEWLEEVNGKPRFERVSGVTLYMTAAEAAASATLQTGIIESMLNEMA